MKLLRRWLTPPVFADEEQTRVARLLHWVLLSLLVATLFDTGILFALAPEILPSFWLNGVFFVILLLSFGIMRLGMVRTAGLLVSLTFWLLLVLYLLESGGVTSPSFGYFAVVIIFCAVLLGLPGALAIGALSIGVGVLLYIAGNNGWLTSIEPAPTPGRLLATNTTLFAILTLLMSISGRSVSNALNRARTDEQSLAERNQQLQAEIVRREQAQREQARLAAILEATSDFVSIANVSGKVLYGNQAARRLFGISENALAETTIADYHPAQITELIFNEAIPAAIRDGTWSGETILLTRDGHEIPVSQVIIAHRDADGAVEYTSTILRDISDRKQAEQQRLELALQEQRMASFKDFLAMISHDLKTPMSVIQTSLYLLERLDDPQRRKEKIENIQWQMTLLQKYIEDLLVLTRLNRVPELNFAPLDVNALLNEVQSRFLPAAEEKKISLNMLLSAALPRIPADKQELYHALANLIENAIYYTPAGGSVTVSTGSDETGVLIEVADTGIGIDPKELVHIFERFYRSEQAQQMHSGGTGLGLAIVKRIVEVHNGRIEIKSTPGTGTTFSIWLPLSP